VYLLELAGTDDAFAAREAASAADAVEVLAPGLATARDTPRLDVVSRLVFVVGLNRIRAEKFRR
jgi:hypothetical protein